MLALLTAMAMDMDTLVWGMSLAVGAVVELAAGCGRAAPSRRRVGPELLPEEGEEGGLLCPLPPPPR